MMFANNKIVRAFRIFRRAYGEYKYRALLQVALSFANSVLEGVGITAIIPIFSFIVKNQNPSSDFISNIISRVFGYFNIAFSLRYLLVFVAFLLFSKVVVLFLANYLAAKMAAEYESRTRDRLLSATLSANWSVLSKQKIGHLDQVVTTDVINASSLLLNLNTFLLFLAQLITYTLVAVNISFVVTVLVGIVGLLILFVFKKYFYLNKVVGRQGEQLYKKVAHFINQNVLGLKTVKAMAVEDSVIKEGVGYFGELRRINIKTAVFRNITTIFIQPIGILFVIGVFTYLYKTTNFNFASFVVIIFAIGRIFTQIQTGQTQLHNIIGLVPYLQNILNYTDLMEGGREETTGALSFVMNVGLEFKNVSFSYPGRDLAISDVSFLLKKGELTGLIGPSGAGKTTIADLCLRLFYPVEGKILLDAVDSRGVSLKEWRKNIGYVSQDNVLINDTVEANIRFYDSSISENDVMAAARSAYIYDFIKSMPNGFSTVIGDRGIDLSAGQRQRVMLARVLARRPRMLILDEATSALDNESEDYIQNVINNLRGSVTVLIIAHRLSTIINCDNLLVLDRGKIAESGSPQSLLSDESSYFFKMYNIKVK